MINYLHPTVAWAQRADRLFVRIELEEVTDEKITVNGTNLNFSGKSLGKDYQVYLEFNHEIVPEKSKQKKGGRAYHFELLKKEPGPYWPKLLKDPIKPHYLKIDFNRWKDEDSTDDEAGGGDFADANLEDMMQQMGTGGAGGFDPPEGPYSDDSDDEDPPELEADTGKSGE